MPGRTAVTSAFQNLRPTIMREPARSTVSPEAEARLFEIPEIGRDPNEVTEAERSGSEKEASTNISISNNPPVPLLHKKKRERLLLVSFRMPQGLKEKLELVAKTHEINQTDIINEGLIMNLQRYL